MEQPLCHLYFLTVMEHLWSKFIDTNIDKIFQLVEYATSIQDSLNKATSTEKVMLHLEMQAVIQVLIRSLAYHFHPEYSSRIRDVQPLITEINR